MSGVCRRSCARLAMRRRWVCCSKGASSFCGGRQRVRKWRASAAFPNGCGRGSARNSDQKGEGQRTNGRGQTAEDKGQRTKGRGQRAEDDTTRSGNHESAAQAFHSKRLR